MRVSALARRIFRVRIHKLQAPNTAACLNDIRDANDVDGGRTSADAAKHVEMGAEISEMELYVHTRTAVMWDDACEGRGRMDGWVYGVLL